MPRKSKPRKGAEPKKPSLSPEMERLFEEQADAFRKKFGRDPGPGDPIIFDPDSDTPKPIDAEELMVETIVVMRTAGFPPQYEYAYRKTGLLVTEMNKDRIPKDDLEEWDAAIDEYFLLNSEDDDDDDAVATVSLGVEDKDEAIELIKKMSDPDKETDPKKMFGPVYRYSEKNPGFKGVFEFEVTTEVFAKKHTQRCRAEYEYTPEWEYYDLNKKALFEGWAGSVMTVYAWREWSDGKGDHEGWLKAPGLFEYLSEDQDNAIYDAIDDKCMEEDAKRRQAAGAPPAANGPN